MPGMPVVFKEPGKKVGPTITFNVDLEDMRAYTAYDPIKELSLALKNYKLECRLPIGTKDPCACKSEPNLGVTFLLEKGSTVVNASFVNYEESARKYSTRTEVSHSTAGCGLIISGKHVSAELLGIMRDIVPPGAPIIRDKLIRFKLGARCKDVKAAIEADEEKIGVYLEGKVNKWGTKFRIDYKKVKPTAAITEVRPVRDEEPEVVSELVDMLNEETNVDISAPLLKWKGKEVIRLGLKYEQIKNTLRIKDATNKTMHQLWGPTLEVHLGKVAATFMIDYAFPEGGPLPGVKKGFGAEVEIPIRRAFDFIPDDHDMKLKVGVLAREDKEKLSVMTTYTF